ncbi:MAG: NAD-dependent deacylase [Candidatus Obscuribacterales bacterium]|nr:NAD-dependent deacylase [Candidatus Obscuribacterales bacterium]
MSSSEIQAAAKLLLNEGKAIFFTGAGVSKESGIPTFRDAMTGLWANYDPEELATPQAFKRNPSLVWQWYDERRARLGQISPNPGHHAIADLESLKSKVLVITQNVDGLHKLAGSSDVLELHGNISEFFCFDHRHAAKNIPLGLKEAPKCHCGSLIRPAVVWFNEALPEDEFARAQKEILQASVLFVIGTSALVHPAAGLPILALQNHIDVVEINPDDTPLSRSASLILRGASGKILPEIVAEFKKMKSDK